MINLNFDGVLLYAFCLTVEHFYLPASVLNRAFISSYRIGLEINLFPLLHPREIKYLTTFYKFNSGLYSCDIGSFVSFCSDTRLRFTLQGKIKTPRCRNELFNATYFNRIVYLWNNSPESVRISSGRVGKLEYYCRFVQNDIL